MQRVAPSLRITDSPCPVPSWADLSFKFEVNFLYRLSLELYLDWREAYTVGVKILAPKRDIITPARARTWTESNAQTVSPSCPPHTNVLRTYFSFLTQLFASVAPILLLETRSDGNEEESELDDISGKVNVM